MQSTMAVNANVGLPPPMYQEQVYQESPLQHQHQQQQQRQEAPPPQYSEMVPDSAPTYQSQNQTEPRRDAKSSTSEMVPCVVPQTTATWKGPYNCPFIRAYPPGLEERGVDKATFLSFVDSVNESFVMSPVFYVAGAAGHIMTLCHGVHPVQWAGMGLSATSIVVGSATSYLRTRATFKKANAELFHPLGLTATVMTTKKLTQLVKYPNEKLELLPINHSGRKLSSSSSSNSISESDPDSDSDSDFEDVEDDEKQDQSDKINLDSGTMLPAGGMPGGQMIARRLEPLQGYIQPLSLDVPPSERSENLLRRMGEWQAKRLADKQHRKMERSRAKGHFKRDKQERKARRREMKTQGKIAKLEFKLEHTQSPYKRGKIEDKIERKAAKGERKVARRENKGERKLDRRVNKKENRIANRVRWIVIKELPEQKEEDSDEVMFQDDDEMLSADEREFISQEAKKQ